MVIAHDMLIGQTIGVSLIAMAHSASHNHLSDPDAASARQQDAPRDPRCRSPANSPRVQHARGQRRGSSAASSGHGSSNGRDAAAASPAPQPEGSPQPPLPEGSPPPAPDSSPPLQEEMKIELPPHYIVTDRQLVTLSSAPKSAGASLTVLNLDPAFTILAAVTQARASFKQIPNPVCAHEQQAIDRRHAASVSASPHDARRSEHRSPEDSRLSLPRRSPAQGTRSSESAERSSQQQQRRDQPSWQRAASKDGRICGSPHARQCDPVKSPSPAGRPPLHTSRPGSCLPSSLPPVRLGPPPPVRLAATAVGVPAQSSSVLGSQRHQPWQRQGPPPEPQMNPLPAVPAVAQPHAFSPGAASPYSRPRPQQQLMAEHQRWPGLAPDCTGLLMPAGTFPAVQIPGIPLCGPGGQPCATQRPY